MRPEVNPPDFGLSKEALDEMLLDFVRDWKQQKATGGVALYRTPDGIVRFVRDVIHADPAPYQERILRALVEYKRVAVRGPHGLGKTAIASWVTLWAMYAFTDDVKVLTTASVHRQLQKFLWPEIRKWARRIQWAENARPRILDLSIKMPGKEAFAI